LEVVEQGVDALVLYNEREVVEPIIAGLEQRGISTKFWRRDTQFGSPVEGLEQQQVVAARSILVLLGREGWGPNHLRLTIEARRLGRQIVPALVGDPPEAAFAEASGLFEKLRYVDLRKLDPVAFDMLASQIRAQESNESDRFDEVVQILADGNDGERYDALKRIVTDRSIDRKALGERLRTEIRERYNPGSEENYATAIRDPKRTSSARSWMLSALIWSDAENAASRDLILEHLQPSFEPDRSVRFWVVAGLYSRAVSYLPDALNLAQEDTTPEISGLVKAIRRPAGDDVIQDLREQLHAAQFEDVWNALRILRIVPLTSLVSDLCAILDVKLGQRSLTYDVLYALSGPTMSLAAAPILSERPGVLGMVERITDELRTSGGNALSAFAEVLAAFDPGQVERALNAASLRPSRVRSAQELRRVLAVRLSSADDGALYIAGYSSDTVDVGRERLGIDEDVQTLTAVMLAQQVKPPLAIGLFGDWGSGKSYFMKSLNAAAGRLTKRAKEAKSLQFCHDIVQIEFNAWHYADTNLWASLVSTILERLATHVTPGKTPEEEQAALLKELGSAKSSIDEANAVKNYTEESIVKSQKKLVQLQRDRHEKEITLRDIRAADVKQLLQSDPAVRKELDEALKESGMPVLIGSAEDLTRVVMQAFSLQGRLTSLFLAFTRGSTRWVVLASVAVIVAAPYALHQLLGSLDGPLSRLVTISSELLLAIGGVTTVIGSAVSRVSKNLDRIQVAKTSVDTLIAKKRSESGPEESALQQEILELKAQEQEAAARVSAAATRVTELEDRIRTMKEARTLARFLDERTSSDDYRKYLGLISTVRRDFEALSKRLKDARSDGTGLGRVDRIILYIDDLDRCPAEKVMEVLQAVHLLLAYELFVVVVGVDPRWLLHSLEKTHTAFQRSVEMAGPLSELWVATPRDYLEKIFQIPFSVMPMSESGYGRLMSDLLASADGNGQTSAHQKAPTPDVDENLGAVEPKETSVPDISTTGNIGNAAIESVPMMSDQSVLPRGVAPQAAPHDFTIHEEALAIQPWEAAFAEQLFPLIPTPRAAKRFSNVYRILKAPVRRNDLERYEGTAAAPGDFRVPMLLLAILIGAPLQAVQLFPALYREAAENNDITSALRYPERLGLEGPQFAALASTLGPIVGSGVGPASAFCDWLPRVSRFSFDVGRGVSRAPASRLLAAQT
jgi:hypothetical protein